MYTQGFFLYNYHTIMVNILSQSGTKFMLYTYIICIPKITQNVKTYPNYETVSDVVLP